jgi:hypothetical protein
MDDSIKRGHPLYERHLEYKNELVFKKWFENRRREDIAEWHSIRRGFEAVSDLDVERKSALVSLHEARAKEKEKERARKLEEKRLRKIAREEERKHVKLMTQKALELFHTKHRDKSYYAWKEYVLFVKAQRKEKKCVIS